MTGAPRATSANDASSGNTAALDVRNLSVRFGDFPALREVSFTLPGASVLAILGPNGGGKSTLLRILLGLLAPSEGEVRVLGERPERVPAAAIGYVPQVKTLDRTFPARAIDLVVNGLCGRWPGRAAPDDVRRAGDALAAVGGAHLAGRALGRLSGGELQRVYLARGLARRPELLLLDEPSSGIDAAGEQDMYRLLDAYHRDSGATIVMVTHDWEAAYHHASHVLVLSGKIVGFGTPREALTDLNLRRAFGHVDHDHGMHMRSEQHGHGHDGSCGQEHDGACGHDHGDSRGERGNPPDGVGRHDD